MIFCWAFLEIRYNLLNLPMSVQQAYSSDMARFIYLSDGTLTETVRGDGTQHDKKPFSWNHLTNKVKKYLLKNGWQRNSPD